jgi:hypothetical protein
MNRQDPAMTVELEITVGDARLCNRLRGLSITTCSCRTADGWRLCPPGAHLALLSPEVIRDCLRLAEATPFTRSHSVTRPPSITGEFCREDGCGGLLVRTGSCMTCQSCGFNEGCG